MELTVETVKNRFTQVLAGRPDLSMELIAAHSPLSPSVVRHFQNGSGTPTVATARAIDTVLDLVERGDILAPGGGRGTVISEASEPAKRVARLKNSYITDTVRRVEKVLDFCAEEAAIGMVIGPYGAGKSEAVRMWRRKQRRVLSIGYEFDEFTARNKVAFIAAVAELMGVDVVAGPQFGGLTFRRVCTELCQKPALLIFDQCEGLSLPVFQVMRQIHDRTHEAGVGMAILAAPVLLDRMNSSQSKVLGALTSRVGLWGMLRGLSQEEMADIVKKEGLKDVDEAAFDLWYRACAGSMRRLMKSLDLLQAKHAGRRIGEKTIRDVAAHLWGMAVEGI